MDAVLPRFQGVKPGDQGVAKAELVAVRAVKVVVTVKGFEEDRVFHRVTGPGNVWFYGQYI